MLYICPVLFQVENVHYNIESNVVSSASWALPKTEKRSAQVSFELVGLVTLEVALLVYQQIH